MTGLPISDLPLTTLGAYWPNVPIAPLEREPLSLGPGLLFFVTARIPRSVMVVHHINHRVVGHSGDLPITLHDTRCVLHAEALATLTQIISDHLVPLAQMGRDPGTMTVFLSDLGIADSVLTETIRPDVLDPYHPYTAIQLSPPMKEHPPHE